MRIASTYLLRILGGAIVIMAAGPVLAALLGALVRGPAQAPLGSAAASSARHTLSQSADAWWSLGRSLGIAAMATALAFALAMPAAFTLLHATRRWTRVGLAALIAWPLLAPPCVIAYAWTLLMTQDNALSQWLVKTTAWHSPRMAPVVAAWIQANWLWPIPALVMTAAFTRSGRATMRMAILDTTPANAFLRAALPAMSAALLAAAAMTALLSLGDSAIAPLVLVRTWPGVMLEEAKSANRFADPTRFIIWRSWPMLGVLGAIGIALLLFAQRRLQTARLDDSDSLGDARPHGGVVTSLAASITALVSLSPTAILIAELATSRTPWKSIWSSLLLNRREWQATLAVAALAGLCGLALGVIGLIRADNARSKGRLRAAALIALLLTAALPPVMIGHSLIRAFNFSFGIPANWKWQVYTHTPLAWLAGIVARFGCIPMLLAWWASRSAGRDGLDAARVNGASPTQVLAFVQIPAHGRTLAAGALLLACMALSEIAVSSLVTPVCFGGSLAFAVDQQVHFGRQPEVIAMTLLLVMPAVAAAALLATWFTRRSKR